MQSPAVKIFAEKHNIPVHQPQPLREIIPIIQSINHPVGVLVSFGKIISDEILALFEDGIINVHPSLLPLYRGPSPIESAILGGDTETGISIMRLEHDMDAGPVYVQERTPLLGNETQPYLYDKLAKQGAALLVKSLGAIVSGEITAIEQDAANATYCKLLSKEDALLRPDLYSAAILERKIRAHLAYPKTNYTLQGHNIIITRATLADYRIDASTISCVENSFLHIDELIAPSGRKMTSDAFLRGYTAKTD